jgi:V/A-type H+-transporting ATPase subunit I
VLGSDVRRLVRGHCAVGRPASFSTKDIGSLALWFEPVREPDEVVDVLVFVWIIHLFVGLGVRFAMLWKAGKPLEAVLDVIPYLLVLGVAPMGAGIILTVPPQFAAVGKYLALAGAVSIVLTSGVPQRTLSANSGAGYTACITPGPAIWEIFCRTRAYWRSGFRPGFSQCRQCARHHRGNSVIKAVMLVFVFICGALRQHCR